MSESNKITQIRVDGKTYDIDLPGEKVQKLEGSINSVSATLDTFSTSVTSRIDAIEARTDVVDVVNSYSSTAPTLNNYDVATISANDIIKVLNDETHGNATSYYRYTPNATGQSTTWTYIGKVDAYYTTTELNPMLESITTNISSVSANLAAEVTARQNAINGLDVDAFSLASTAANVVTLKKIKEADGKIADGGADDISFYNKAGADSAISTAIDALDNTVLHKAGGETISGSLTINGSVTVNDALSLNGSADGKRKLSLGSQYISTYDGDSRLYIHSNSTIKTHGSILPDADNADSLGASNARFKTIYVSGSLSDGASKLSIDEIKSSLGNISSSVSTISSSVSALDTAMATEDKKL